MNDLPTKLQRVMDRMRRNDTTLKELHLECEKLGLDEDCEFHSDDDDDDDGFFNEDTGYDSNSSVCDSTVSSTRSGLSSSWYNDHNHNQDKIFSNNLHYYMGVLCESMRNNYTIEIVNIDIDMIVNQLSTNTSKRLCRKIGQLESLTKLNLYCKGNIVNIAIYITPILNAATNLLSLGIYNATLIATKEQDIINFNAALKVLCCTTLTSFMCFQVQFPKHSNNTCIDNDDTDDDDYLLLGGEHKSSSRSNRHHRDAQDDDIDDYIINDLIQSLPPFVTKLQNLKLACRQIHAVNTPRDNGRLSISSQGLITPASPRSSFTTTTATNTTPASPRSSFTLPLPFAPFSSSSSGSVSGGGSCPSSPKQSNSRTSLKASLGLTSPVPASPRSSFTLPFAAFNPSTRGRGDSGSVGGGGPGSCPSSPKPNKSRNSLKASLGLNNPPASPRSSFTLPFAAFSPSIKKGSVLGLGPGSGPSCPSSPKPNYNYNNSGRNSRGQSPSRSPSRSPYGRKKPINMAVATTVQTASSLSLFSSQSAQSLSSSNSVIAGKTIENLFQIQNLKTLSLNGMDLGTNGNQMDYLAMALKTNTSLESLNLCCTEINDNGCIQLFESLQQNTINSNIKELHLASNWITYKSAHSISNYLRSSTNGCPKLELLNLSTNDIGDHGCVIIARSLCSNISLKILHLSYCQLNDEAIQGISCALLYNTSLRDLYIKYNQDITKVGYTALLQVLREQKNHTIHNIIVDHRARNTHMLILNQLQFYLQMNQNNVHNQLLLLQQQQHQSPLLLTRTQWMNQLFAIQNMMPITKNTTALDIPNLKLLDQSNHYDYYDSDDDNDDHDDDHDNNDEDHIHTKYDNRGRSRTMRRSNRSRKSNRNHRNRNRNRHHHDANVDIVSTYYFFLRSKPSVIYNK